MVFVRRRTIHSPLGKIIHNALSHTGPTVRPLERLKQTKIFIRAKVNGASTPEAKRLSHLPGNMTTIMNDPLTQHVIEALVKEEEFRDPGLVQRLKEMWHHKRVRFQKVGDEVETIHEDDTDMWKYSMDKVLKLRGYLKDTKEETSGESVLATQGITFNVLQVPDEAKK